MKLPKPLQRKLDKFIPKKDQGDFIESAIEEKLEKHIALQAETVEIFVDGGSRGNPGPSGGGFAIFRGGIKVLQGCEFYGKKTNNQAEYLALRTALRAAYAKFPDIKVKCFMDSKLVAEQMSGNFKVKNQNIRPLFDEVSRIAAQFKDFSITHISREENPLADKLANEAMDKKS